ncbi:MAG: type I 3-dehydroquinate dehydratase [Candidatus Hydrothermarchaeales archaeon]
MQDFLAKKPAICAAVMESSVEDFLRTVKKIEGADLVEIRIDGLKEPSPQKVKGLLKGVRDEIDLSIILTNRKGDEGGSFAGGEEKRIGTIKECMGLADAIDIELGTERRYRDEIVEAAKGMDAPVIISYHDFVNTPGEGEMQKLLEEEFEIGADVAKLAVMPNSKSDVLRLLSVTQRTSKLGNVCTISMGGMGKISRILAPFFGSCMTYASVGTPTAPGQMSVSEIREIWKILGV